MIKACGALIVTWRRTAFIITAVIANVVLVAAGNSSHAGVTSKTAQTPLRSPVEPLRESFDKGGRLFTSDVTLLSGFWPKKRLNWCLSKVAKPYKCIAG